MSSIIKYQPFKKVFLFGGTPLTIKLANELSKNYKVVIWTAPRQVAELGNFERLDLHIAEDINDHLKPKHIGTTDIGIGLGEAWSFGPKLCKAFGNRLIDFMGIPYPSYLGGAHVTHALLRDETYWGCCMQLVTSKTKQGECHDGEIIHGTHLDFSPDLDYAYIKFIVNFIDNANKGKAFLTDDTGLPPYMHRFFPRLNTVKQGWIDWSWNTKEIVNFIKAFDTPYPGARTMLDDEIVTLHNPTDLNVEKSHPFQAGLIIDWKNPQYAVVATRGGSISVEIRGASPQLGERLFTSRDQIEKAMQYSPEYNAIGDAHA